MRVILKQLYKELQLALCAINEVHCLSRYGKKEGRNHSNKSCCVCTCLTSLYSVVLLLSFYLLAEALTFVIIIFDDNNSLLLLLLFKEEWSSSKRRISFLGCHFQQLDLSGVPSSTMWNKKKNRRHRFTLMDAMFERHSCPQPLIRLEAANFGNTGSLQQTSL